MDECCSVQITLAVVSFKKICPFLHKLWISNWDMTFKNNEIFTQRKVLAYYHWCGDENLSTQYEIGWRHYKGDNDSLNSLLNG